MKMQPGDIVSYLEMCTREGVSLQRGMNFRLGSDYSVVLMSVRAGAPYDDRVEDDGRTLIYEGHDEPKGVRSPDPKTLDQPLFTPNGTLTQNGLFFRGAESYRNGETPPERVRVYEKVRQGIWTYVGLFHLVDAWFEPSEGRQVCKFRLTLVDQQQAADDDPNIDLEHTRVIPSHVKVAVWQRDKGRCVKCGAAANLHFDHVIPFSKGGSSLLPSNIQLLCAVHNLQKRDKVE